MALRSEPGIYLTRVPGKTQPEGTPNQFGSDNPLLEYVPFSQIAWASTYVVGPETMTLILLNTLEFRCYLQSIEFVKQKVCEFVGRNAKEGKSSPSFPWILMKT